MFVNEDVDFQKNGTHRFFLHAPPEATWAGKLKGYMATTTWTSMYGACEVYCKIDIIYSVPNAESIIS